MERLTPEEKRRVNEYLQRRREQYEIKMERKARIMSRLRSITFFLQDIFYPPLRIMFNLMNVICRLFGCIISIGLPYGIYCIYKTVEIYERGMNLLEIEYSSGAIIFGIFPFIAFLLSAIFSRLADFFE